MEELEIDLLEGDECYLNNINFTILRINGDMVSIKNGDYIYAFEPIALYVDKLRTGEMINYTLQTRRILDIWKNMK